LNDAFASSISITDWVQYQGHWYWVDNSSDDQQSKSLYRLNRDGDTEICRLFDGSGPVGIVVAGGWMFLERQFSDKIPDEAVWRSNGTTAGTTVVHAFSSGDVQYTSSFAGANTMFFVAPVDNDHPNNLELWAVQDDGNAHLLKDIRPGS